VRVNSASIYIVLRSESDFSKLETRLVSFLSPFEHSRQLLSLFQTLHLRRTVATDSTSQPWLGPALAAISSAAIGLSPAELDTVANVASLLCGTSPPCLPAASPFAAHNDTTSRDCSALDPHHLDALPQFLLCDLHPHPLEKRASVYEGSYMCDACRKYGSGHAYHCPMCQFDAHPSCAASVHDLPLRRIESSDPELTQLKIRKGSKMKEAGFTILALVLSHNTCITSLDLEHTTVGPSGGHLLFPALTHLTSLTYLNLGYTGFQSSAACHLCSALTHLTALTKLDLKYNKLTADDGARICGAAAAAGMTRLKKLDLNENGFNTSSLVGCSAWKQLNLPQPPDEIVRECGAFDYTNYAPLVSYLLSEDKVASYAIRIFVVGDSTVRPPPHLSLLRLLFCTPFIYLNQTTFPFFVERACL
jgi:hypothetical protein